MSEQAIAILHGPHLKAEKQPKGQKRTPYTFQIPFRAPAPMCDWVEKIARENGVARADVIRTAVAEYMQKYASLDAVSIVNEPAALPAISQPRQVSPYRGNGKSDHTGLMKVNQRQSERLRRGDAGERVMDKAPVR